MSVLRNGIFVLLLMLAVVALAWRQRGKARAEYDGLNTEGDAIAFIRSIRSAKPGAL